MCQTYENAGTGLYPGLVVQHLAEVDGGLLVTLRAVERRRSPGRQRDQRAALHGRPLLECTHKGPADAVAAVLAADKYLLDPAQRPVGVKSEVPEAEEIAQALLSIHREEEAGVAVGEQGRVAAAEPLPGERERLRQLAS